uniref:sulfite oxidase heme-binding subunit YedZ n=1 Tax=Thaumasiovibrio occultus TaxID=1891184 RepID=UPI000B3550B5|nr:protein-methionine-sulfoxide reductase heme-binding subunit MsrQ [Thaumasiovibrio occultus]
MVLKLTANRVLWLKGAIHTLNLGFVAYFLALTFGGGFGIDPWQQMSHFTGTAGLNLLIITLLVSPVAKAMKAGGLIRLRRMLGLYCFFWATLHIAIFFWLNLGWDVSLISSEIVSRPYLVVGFTAYLLLFLLAVTSFKRLQVAMKQRWQTLHNFVYLIALLVPWHYLWSVKSNPLVPYLYLAFALFLLYLRRDKFSKVLSIRKINTHKTY